jgi:hypothetical protein
VIGEVGAGAASVPAPTPAAVWAGGANDVANITAVVMAKAIVRLRILISPD